MSKEHQSAPHNIVAHSPTSSVERRVTRATMLPPDYRNGSSSDNGSSDNTAIKQTTKRDRLVGFLRCLPQYMRNELETLKQQGRQQAERDDFLWFIILQSFSTMGNSRGWHGLIGNQSNFNLVAYDYVTSRVKNGERAQHFVKVLSAARVRMPQKKAEWLDANLTLIEQLGGIEKANQLAFSQRGRLAKIRFMKTFAGVGDKYARNIWMDTYDPDFLNAIAIDDRIKKISAALNVGYRQYEDHERFYLELARDAGISGWELDRLMYNFNQRILSAIAG